MVTAIDVRFRLATRSALVRQVGFLSIDASK
jgi:hypothetical protein